MKKNYKAWVAGVILVIAGLSTGNVLLMTQGAGFLAAPELSLKE